MLYAYMDESYSDNGYFYIGALVLTDGQRRCVEQKLGALRAQVSRDYGIDAGAEFHGYPMFHYRAEWAALAGKHRVAVGVFNAALKSIADCGGALYFQGLNTARHHERYGERAFPPHVIALGFVLEQIHRRASRLGEQVTVIADRVHDQAAHEARIAQYQQVGTFGYRRSFLQSIQLPFQWEDSRDHDALQAIDLATFIYRRHDSHTDLNAGAAAAVQRLYETLRPALAHHRVWLR